MDNLLGNSMPAPLRGVTSTSSIWDGQVLASPLLGTVLQRDLQVIRSCAESLQSSSSRFVWNS